MLPYLKWQQSKLDLSIPFARLTPVEEATLVSLFLIPNYKNKVNEQGFSRLKERSDCMERSTHKVTVSIRRNPEIAISKTAIIQTRPFNTASSAQGIPLHFDLPIPTARLSPVEVGFYKAHPLYYIHLLHQVIFLLIYLSQLLIYLACSNHFLSQF